MLNCNNMTSKSVSVDISYENEITYYEPFKFFDRQTTDDLEIDTIDEKKLYVNRQWLSTISPYFNALLNNGLLESSKKCIKLAHQSKILDIIFRYLYFGNYGINYLRKECMSKVEKVEELYDFFSACEEYLLDQIKRHGDKFFSTLELSSFLTLAENIELMIKTVRTFNLLSMKLAFYENIRNNNIKIKSIKFNNMPCEVLIFFCPLNWEIFIRVVILWMKEHNPTDDDLIPISKINYHDMPKLLIDEFFGCVFNLQHAKEFKFTVYECMLSVHYPKYRKEKEQSDLAKKTSLSSTGENK